MSPNLIPEARPWLLDPEAFFADRKLGLGLPLAFVGATVLLGVVRRVVATYVQARLSGTTPPSLVPPDRFAVMAALAWWAIVVGFYVGSFFLLTLLVSRGVSVGPTVAVIGWGFVPKLLVGLVGMIGVVAGKTGPLTLNMSSAGVRATGFMLLEGLLVLGALYWSARIWYHGMAAANDLDDGELRTVVGGPVALAATFDVLFVLGVLGGAVGFPGYHI